MVSYYIRNVTLLNLFIDICNCNSFYRKITPPGLLVDICNCKFGQNLPAAKSSIFLLLKMSGLSIHSFGNN